MSELKAKFRRSLFRVVNTEALTKPTEVLTVNTAANPANSVNDEDPRDFITAEEIKQASAHVDRHRAGYMAAYMREYRKRKKAG